MSSRQPQQRGHREADHVEVVALDRLDQRRPSALDGVPAGALAPLAGGEVPVERRASSSARKRTRVTATSLRSSPSLDAARSRSSPRACGRRAARRKRLGLGLVARLAEPAPSSTTAVSTPSTRSPADRARLAQRVLDHELARIAVASAPRRPAPRPGTSTPSCSRIALPLRRAGRRAIAATAHSSGKKSADLARGRLRRVRAVDQVGLDLERRSRRGSSPARTRAGWWRRSPGARPPPPRSPRAPAPPAGRR